MKSKQDSCKNKDYEIISGTVDRIVFRADNTGYTVLRLTQKDTKEKITIVGKIPMVNPGETGEFMGLWVENKKFGRQFHTESYREQKPSTLEGIEKYLSSGMVKGIGPELAKRMVKKFGVSTLEVIENQPERMKEVEGIGEKRIDMILSAWGEQKYIRDIMVFLQGYGLGPARAVKIYKTYGEQSIALIKENPYRLSEDIWGIGFKIADDIAKRMGILQDSPVRGIAATLHCLREAAEDGHCYLPVDELQKKCLEELKIPAEVFPQSLDNLISKSQVIKENEKIYLFAFHLFEETIARYIKDIKESPPRRIIADMKIYYKQQ
jgi:exodeoxyribonuclease V alpha subunit